MIPDQPSFHRITDNLGFGKPPSLWRAIHDCRLLIVVGVTGVGKSTTLREVDKNALDFVELPNRRLLTDQLLIAHLQLLDGAPAEIVTDRKARFAYTRRYRERYPGGMAHALGQLWLAPAATHRLLIFDGLRGVNEVSHALETLPQARFIVLDAPDLVRVMRLLTRNDAFDQVAHQQSSSLSSSMQVKSIQVESMQTDFAALGIAEARQLFTPAEEQQLLTLLQQGEVSSEELVSKLQIVIEERRNYDPTATRAVLSEKAPERTLIVDTTRYTPPQVAQQIAEWIVHD